jgi:hypothetical protein
MFFIFLEPSIEGRYGDIQIGAKGFYGPAALVVLGEGV